MLDPAREKKLEELFRLAVDVPPAEHGAFLERHCGADGELRKRLQALLAKDAGGTRGALKGTATRAVGGSDERVGAYRLLEVLGEGGMGVVHLAEQEEPVRRKVALKMIRFGLQTDEVAARFERERQALARMNHPGIAKIFESGTTEAGRPWFAMEYVPGVKLTEHCDRARLSIADRLWLFGRVCDAIQHAHQKGVIHRDLKPSNILVTELDGEAVTKVIDFGIAQAVAGELSSHPYQTALGRVVGTYLYMSPEQADPERDVDTRTDVYSLGVLLYELLTGVSPYDEEDPAKLQRAVLESVPPTPSTRVTRLGEESAGVAERRGETARDLPRHLAGDLDWITMKAMEKDRARRYASASELRADVDRHLALEPVTAGPPSTSYRVNRFVRRHRVPVAAAAAVLLLLVVALVASLAAWRSAEAAFRAEQELRREAELRREVTLARVEFLEHALFRAPSGPRSAAVVGELLDVAVADVPAMFGGRAEAEAAVRYSLGSAYLVLGEPEKAREQLLTSYAIQTGPLGKDDEDVFYTLEGLIRASRAVGGLNAAEPYVEHSLALAVELVGDEDPALRDALAAMVEAPDGEGAAARLDEASSLFANVLGKQDKMLFVGRVLAETGIALHDQEQLELSEAYLKELETIARAHLTHGSTRFLLCLWRFADSYLRLSPPRSERAAELALELTEAIEGRLPPDHWMHAEARRILEAARMGRPTDD